MKPIAVKVKQGRMATERTEVLVFGHYEGDPKLQGDAATLDKALDGGLRDLLKSGEFLGKWNQTALLHTQNRIPAKRVLLVGLGKKKDANLDTLRQALGTVAKRVRQAGARSFSVPLLGPLPQTSAIEIAQAMVEGAILGSYQFTAYRSNDRETSKPLEHITVVTSRAGALRDMQQGVRRGLAGAEAAAYVRDLCNHPSNVMTPSRIAVEAKNLAKERGVKVKVLEKRDVEKLGMGAFLGVGRGSHEPPKFIVLEYRGGGRSRGAAPTVLVGKTITFDTGGISLKPSENMERMKGDMTGGAEVLATIRAASRLRLPLHLIGLLPATENMPGGRAIKPGDILTTLSGKTVEVQNTDAEGRLIL
ncbi:MAG: leucyl aminopeptidase, partial [Nitrospira sp.]|nr:leucyl aminopeptidase [Nitrospira sp.]